MIIRKKMMRKKKERREIIAQSLFSVCKWHRFEWLERESLSMSQITLFFLKQQKQQGKHEEGEENDDDSKDERKKKEGKREVNEHEVLKRHTFGNTCCLWPAKIDYLLNWTKRREFSLRDDDDTSIVSLFFQVFVSVQKQRKTRVCLPRQTFLGFVWSFGMSFPASLDTLPVVERDKFVQPVQQKRRSWSWAETQDDYGLHSLLRKEGNLSLLLSMTFN